MVDKVTHQGLGNGGWMALVLFGGSQAESMTSIKKALKVTAASRGTGIFLCKAAFTKKACKQTVTETSATPVCLLCYEGNWFCDTCSADTFRTLTGVILQATPTSLFTHSEVHRDTDMQQYDTEDKALAKDRRQRCIYCVVYVFTAREGWKERGKKPSTKSADTKLSKQHSSSQSAGLHAGRRGTSISDTLFWFGMISRWFLTI